MRKWLSAMVVAVAVAVLPGTVSAHVYGPSSHATGTSRTYYYERPFLNSGESADVQREYFDGWSVRRYESWRFFSGPQSFTHLTVSVYLDACAYQGTGTWFVTTYVRSPYGYRSFSQTFNNTIYNAGAC